MKMSKMTNEEIIKALDNNPNLRSRMEELIIISKGGLNKEITWGDTAEALVVEQIQGLGIDILQGWAGAQNEVSIERFKEKFKNRMKSKSKKKGAMAY
jgi:hypothetical protein